MRLIFVYHDYANHNAALWFALARRYKNVRYVDANDIAGGVLAENPSMLVLPGGPSRYVAAKLNGVGNAAIKHYVAGGGRYLGICGGAYYGCKNIYWKNGDQQISVENELGFFPGGAQGPIAAFCEGANTTNIVALTIGRAERPALYWGGPRFHDVDASSATTLARYAALSHDDAAVITGIHEKGRYLLISPHLEFDDTALDLMRFDVVDNAYADIAALPRAPGLALDYFYTLLDEFLES